MARVGSFAIGVLTMAALAGCADATEEAGFSPGPLPDGSATLYLARVTGTEPSESGCLDEIPSNWKPGKGAPCGLDQDVATLFEIDVDSAFRARVVDAEEHEVTYAAEPTWVVAVVLDERSTRRFQQLSADSLDKIEPYRIAVIAGGEVLTAPVPQPGVEQAYGRFQIEGGGDAAYSEEAAADLAARLRP